MAQGRLIELATSFKHQKSLVDWCASNLVGSLNQYILKSKGYPTPYPLFVLFFLSLVVQDTNNATLTAALMLS